MGNICRSPSAEGFFTHHLQKSDSRAIAEAAGFGVDISALRARRVTETDFAHFDLILGMDQHNLQLLNRMQPTQSRAKTGLMMDYAPEAGYQEVPDPYYGTHADFRLMCELLDRATQELVRQLESGTGP
jgi:protein-tyrosine phosphatase